MIWGVGRGGGGLPSWLPDFYTRFSFYNDDVECYTFLHLVFPEIYCWYISDLEPRSEEPKLNGLLEPVSYSGIAVPVPFYL
jgi:hypothetical protein